MTVEAEVIDTLNRLSAAFVDRYGRFGEGPRPQWVDPSVQAYVGVPNVNLGPCGPISLAFMNRWNRSGIGSASLAYFIDDATEHCRHIVTHIGGDQYFDAGYGVVDVTALLDGQRRLGRTGAIDRPASFDHALLVERSGGLRRRYQGCPDFSIEWTRTTIDQGLDRLG